mmetsp:Transcript_33188/g.91786  ORF Transcript_33188/g.91786 Transcript_33188/m.91786 type:complete len:338 (+) Transcript_33188:1252-2265(+)
MYCCFLYGRRVHRNELVERELPRATLGPPRHLNVHAMLEGINAVHACPLRDHHALEAHTVPEVTLEELRVVAGICSIHLVVGAHDGPNPRLHRRLERRVVELPRSPRIDLGAVGHAVRFLMAEANLLQAAHHALALHALDEGVHEARPEVGILTRQALEVPAAVGQTDDAHLWPQHHVGALAPELGTDALRDLVDEVLIPSRSKGEQARENGGSAFRARLGGPEAAAAVLHLQGWQTQPAKRRRVASVETHLRAHLIVVGALQEVGLLEEVQRFPVLCGSFMGAPVLVCQPEDIDSVRLAPEAEGDAALHEDSTREHAQHHPWRHPARQRKVKMVVR